MRRSRPADRPRARRPARGAPSQPRGVSPTTALVATSPGSHAGSIPKSAERRRGPRAAAQIVETRAGSLAGVGREGGAAGEAIGEPGVGRSEPQATRARGCCDSAGSWRRSHSNFVAEGIVETGIPRAAQLSGAWRPSADPASRSRAPAVRPCRRPRRAPSRAGSRRRARPDRARRAAPRRAPRAPLRRCPTSSRGILLEPPGCGKARRERPPGARADRARRRPPRARARPSCRDRARARALPSRRLTGSGCRD